MTEAGHEILTVRFIPAVTLEIGESDGAVPWFGRLVVGAGRSTLILVSVGFMANKLAPMQVFLQVLRV